MKLAEKGVMEKKLIKMLNRVIHMSHACYFYFDIFIQENKIVEN